MAIDIPRIRGKVGQAFEPEEMKGKWFFEMWVTPVGGGEGASLGFFGPWDTEEKAKQELQVAARMACETIEKKVMGQVSGKYIDMKTNETMNWDKH
jgi:hypothetical protein